MNLRAMFLVAALAAFSIALTLVPTNASAQDLGACFRDCQAYTEDLPAENATPAMDAIITSCRNDVPTCRDVEEAAMRSVGSWCSSLMSLRSTSPAPRTSAGNAEGFCVLPDGTHVTDEAGRRCGCPAGTWPIKVERYRSVDRLRSLGVPPGSVVLLCANSMALQGTPGSPDARVDALAATVAAHDEALRALCAANTDPALTAICTEARRQFLAQGSRVGPVDLGPWFRAVEALTEAVAAEHVLVNQLVTDTRTHATAIEGNTRSISAVSSRLDALTQCIQYGVAVRSVTYTDLNGVTRTYPCREFLAANRRQVVEITRHEGGAGLRSFVLVQGVGLLAFNQLRYGNTDYGLPRALAAEITLGIGLSRNWHIQVGGAIGGAWPDVAGVTHAFVMPHIGFGAIVSRGHNVHLSLGFGGLAALRFLPDGALAENIYTPYVEALLRFGAQHTWSPVLGFRFFAGVAPHAVGNGTFEVPFTAGGVISIGFGHF